VSPRAHLDARSKESLRFPYRKSNPGRPARSLVTTLADLLRHTVTITVPIYNFCVVSDLIRIYYFTAM